MYPNVASIQKPEVKYEKTSNGTVPILPNPSSIHFYTKEDGRVIYKLNLGFHTPFLYSF
jgi:hypothetical protein